jgi:hypothetical protein
MATQNTPYSMQTPSMPGMVCLLYPQAAATSMDVGGVSIALLLQQLGAAAAVGSVPQALQQQLCRLPEGIVQLLLQQAAAASVQPGAGAVGAGVAALLAASLLPLLLGMEAAGSPTLLACLVTAGEARARWRRPGHYFAPVGLLQCTAHVCLQQLCWR